MKKFGLQALSVAVVLLTALPAFAADEAAANAFNVKTWAAIGAGLAIGLAVLGGAMGQGRAAAAALEGISRNPGAAAKIQTPMILGLALMESLVLLGFVIAYFLYTFASAG